MGREGIAPPFMTWPLDEGECPASRPGRFTPMEKRPPYPVDKKLSYQLFSYSNKKMSILHKSRDSSVGIATGYGLEDGGVGVRVPVRQQFSLLHVVQTSSGVHPTSYPGVGGVNAARACS
jgi:hypothetical protein